VRYTEEDLFQQNENDKDYESLVILLGTLPPQKEARIKVTLNYKVKMIDGAYSFSLTRAFNPAYRTHKETGAGTGASEA